MELILDVSACDKDMIFNILEYTYYFLSYYFYLLN